MAEIADVKSKDGKEEPDGEEIQYEFEMLGQSKPGEEKTAAQIAKEQAMAEQRKIQEEFDKKNASGAAKELKKSEMVDWRNHETLNKVTKLAIDYFEHSYSYEDYLEERNQKESKLQTAKSGKDGSQTFLKDKSRRGGSDDEMYSSQEEEEEEDDNMVLWDRNEAERMYLLSREILQQLYAQQY